MLAGAAGGRHNLLDPYVQAETVHVARRVSADFSRRGPRATTGVPWFGARHPRCANRKPSCFRSFSFSERARHYGVSGCGGGSMHIDRLSRCVAFHPRRFGAAIDVHTFILISEPILDEFDTAATRLL